MSRDGLEGGAFLVMATRRGKPPVITNGNTALSGFLKWAAPVCHSLVAWAFRRSAPGVDGALMHVGLPDPRQLMAGAEGKLDGGAC